MFLALVTRFDCLLFGFVLRTCCLVCCYGAACVSGCCVLVWFVGACSLQ